MAVTLELLNSAVRDAFRAAWQAVSKASTGAVTAVSCDATDPYAVCYRRTVGSFLADQFDAGDEITVTGFPVSGANGLAIVEYVDATTLQVVRPWGSAVAFASTPAGPSVGITAAMPAIQKLDGFKGDPESGRPWIRETHQPLRTVPAALGASMWRLTGTYWLTVFYPSNRGTAGAERLRGKIQGSIYPAAQLNSGGQLVRVQTATNKPLVEEVEWTGLPVAFSYLADAFTR